MQISYMVDTSMRKENSCEVVLNVDDFPEDVMNVSIPAWVPGSYVIRDYARTVRNFTAATGDGTPLQVKKKDKSTWTVLHTKGSFVRVRYRIYTGDLVPQMSHIDDTHVYLLGADLFMYIDGYREQSSELEVRTIGEEKLITSLDEVGKGKYRAIHYDALADSVIEIGNPVVETFNVEGKLHELVFCGYDRADTAKIAEDTRKIVESVRDLFQYLPYRKYTFFFHTTDSFSASGHEHASACSILAGKPLLEPDGHERLMGLISHEFFHVYNVKRIRPVEFEKFNYSQENYTSLLWFSEGFTSYYGDTMLARAGIIDEKRLMEKFAEGMRLYESIEGGNVTSAASSSFDAWIRLYKSSPDDVNTTVSYYLKGSLIALLLNLRILQYSSSQKSLDDAMKLLWDRFRKDGKGFAEKDLLAVLKEVTGNDLSPFFEKYVNGTEHIDFDSEVATLGYSLVRHRYGEGRGRGSTGLLLRNEGGKFRVVTPLYGYPSYGSGISPGDEILSFNDAAFTQEYTAALVPDFPMSPAIDLLYLDNASGEVELAVLRRGKIRKYAVGLKEPPYSSFGVRKDEDQKFRKIMGKFVRG